MTKDNLKLAQQERPDAILVQAINGIFNINCPKCSCSYMFHASEWDELTILEESCFCCKERVDYILVK